MSRDVFSALTAGGDDGGPAEPGVYFRVQLAGITGHKQFASDSGLLIKANECVAVAAAMIRVFNENGCRADRKKARLKYLIHNWGLPKLQTYSCAAWLKSESSPW